MDRIDFDEFQKQAKRTSVFDVQGEMRRHYLFAGLSAQIGSIADRLKKRLRDGADYVLLKEEIAEHIGYSLWYTAMLADELGLSLNQIAAANITFNERRWHQMIDEKQQQFLAPTDFDSTFPADQRLPKRLICQFETKDVNGLEKTVVNIFPAWPAREPLIPFGNEIDDNSVIEDHYRYHDVFHFAYVAHLQWSPVVRALLKCKRKADANMDRIQDGARARDTEEAATAFIYSYVSQQNFLETSTNVDTGLLTNVRTLLRAYEVRACAEKEWEKAILDAARMLRELVKNRGGWIVVDRAAHILTYSVHAPEGTK